MKAKWKWLFVNLLIITTIVFTASISAFGFTTQKEENEIKPLVGWLQEIWDTIFSSNHLTYGPFEINGNRYIYKGEPIIGDYELDGPLRIDADMELNSHISAKEIEINAEVNVGYSKSLDYPLKLPTPKRCVEP